jgi:Na+/proline symporter
MGLDMTLVTVVTGVVILLYTFLGGLWAVSITDVVQGVLLLSITFTILPHALGLVGGVQNLIKALPALSLNQTYNNVHYTEHWLVAIFIIMCIGTAQGGAQRFYSVKDERDAKRVGKMAGILFLTVPFVFGVPPLVARVIWPDLSQVDFFKPYINKNPQDLVFVGICLKLLPNGLIGVFLAAMLASTMSALSNVYNMVSSVLSRDVYQGLFRPRMTDKDLLRVGRGFSVVIGIAVTVFAVSFVNSKFGIFNQMQTFFTLFNVPVIVPLAFGLLFRNPPKWSAVAATSWGLVVGSTARFVLGWDLGPQVYLSFVLTAGIFLSSRLTGELYKTKKMTLALLAFCFAVGIGILFTLTITDKGLPAAFPLAILSSVVLGISLYGFAGLFASDSVEDKQTVKEFFKKLDTPVDVAAEVFGAGKKQISTFPIVGTIIVAMGLLMSLIFLTNIPHDQLTILAAMITIMISIGVMMIYFGKKSEIRGASGAAS